MSMSFAKIPISAVQTCSNVSCLLHIGYFSLAMQLAVTDMTLELSAVDILVKAFSFAHSIRTLSFVVATIFVGNLTESRHLTLMETAFVDIASLEILFALTMNCVLDPFSFIAIAIFVCARTVTVPLVLSELAMIHFTICFGLMAKSVLFIGFNLALKDVASLCHNLRISLLLSVFP